MRQTRQKERKKDFSRFPIRKNMFALRLIMVDCVHVNLLDVFIFIKKNNIKTSQENGECYRNNSNISTNSLTL